MPVNDPKATKPEDIINNLINGFLSGISSSQPEDQPALVDPVAEVNRLLKKAEEAEYSVETQELLQIADRHIRIVELALAYQK